MVLSWVLRNLVRLRTAFAGFRAPASSWHAGHEVLVVDRVERRRRVRAQAERAVHLRGEGHEAVGHGHRHVEAAQRGERRQEVERRGGVMPDYEIGEGEISSCDGPPGPEI